jgi:hypothetical protein
MLSASVPLLAGSPPWSIWAGLLVLIISLACLPQIERTWRTTGDEPHYLLTAYSLGVDHDFDLTNNYTQHDYLTFYVSQDIAPQIRFSRTGQQILDHQLGLPLLLAPAYALAGRLGVLAFQVVLAGLLAMMTFQLSLLISQDKFASLLAMLGVMLTPPLFFYQYLVYPELLGALLTTLVLYYALKLNRPIWLIVIIVLGSLLVLPWLNRRFVPLALGLALLIAWAWRNHQRSWPKDRNKLLAAAQATFWSPLASLPVGLTILSILALLWFNSQLHDPTTDITTPATTGMLWGRLGRGLGWLVDQQRGLFIFGPIYAFALWGLPALWRQHRRYGFILLPFLLSWVVTTVAGGFWVAWELGPRFLVVGLPALAPLLALAWSHLRHPFIWRGLAIALFGLSFSHTLVIIQNPELPYKSSFPLYYGQKLGLPLSDYLPNLAGYERIEPIPAAAAGSAATLVEPSPLTGLPFGHYRLNWELRTEPNLPPETELARLAVKISGGGPVFNHTLTAAELPTDGSYGRVQYDFFNPNVDRWRTPLLLSAVSAGNAHLWAKDVLLEPNPYAAVWLPLFSVAVLALGVTLAWWRSPNAPQYLDYKTSGASQKYGTGSPFWAKPALRWSVVFVLPLLGLGWLGYEALQPGRSYHAVELGHLAGQAVADPQALKGQAWLVDPQVDPPQKAIYGPFDFFDAGLYRVTFRLKLPQAAKAEQELARLQVMATANYEPLIIQPLRSEHFAKTDLYHDFVLTVTNPRRQALSFEVNYLGVAALLIDQVRVERLVK